MVAAKRPREEMRWLDWMMQLPQTGVGQSLYKLRQMHLLMAEDQLMPGNRMTTSSRQMYIVHYVASKVYSRGLLLICNTSR